MRSAIVLGLVLTMLGTPALAAPSATLPGPVASVFSDPQPTLDHPRKIVLSLSERDPERVNEVIGNVGNIQRFYGADNATIALIVFGPGVHALLASESTVRPRIEGLLAIGIQIYACQATLDTLHKTKADLIGGVAIVPNGIPAIVEREVAGWTYVRP